MTERILNQFTVRVNKAKNQLQETSVQCDQLKKELIKLKKVYCKKELEAAEKEKEEAIKLQDSMKLKYQSAKLESEECILVCQIHKSIMNHKLNIRT